MAKQLFKKASLLTLATSTLLLIGSSAFADGASLYTEKGCAGCHGADAKTPIMPAYPKIAGQGKEYIIQQMTDIKSGARNNGQTASMKGIMAGVSKEEIATISEYLAGLK